MKPRWLRSLFGYLILTRVPSTNPTQPSNQGNRPLRSSLIRLSVHSILWVNASVTHDATKTTTSYGVMVQKHMKRIMGERHSVGNICYRGWELRQGLSFTNLVRLRKTRNCNGHYRPPQFVKVDIHIVGPTSMLTNIAG